MVIDYEINRDVYELLCENQDKPELMCNGKCLLSKKTETTQSSSLTAKVFIDIVYIPTNLVNLHSNLLVENSTQTTFSDQEYSIRKMYYSIPDIPPNC
ncbi:hypothetical protein [Empedobacter brevis]|uniref:hypothetical protein n=1 Tax=Empedobacter brevis TaxID=247 RepID=UPI0039AEB422